MINSQVGVATRIDKELADLSLHHNTLDEGVRAGFSQVNQDLEALDQHVNRQRAECERTEEELHAAEGRIEVLTMRLDTQRELIQDLFAHIESMEGKLCHCGKGKAREPLQDVSPVLGSPLDLGREIPEETDSNNSYHTPPIASSSVPSSSSPIIESNKENVMVLYDSCKPLVEIVDRLIENSVPLPVREPCLDFAGISRLIAVRGQRAICSQGRPKSSFHPYASCCRVGRRSSSHRSGDLCLGFETEGRGRDEGSDPSSS